MSGYAFTEIPAEDTTIRDVCLELAAILRPGLDLAADATCLVYALPPAVADAVLQLRPTDAGYAVHPSTSDARLAGAEPPPAELLPPLQTRVELRAARRAAIRAGEIHPPATPILDAWHATLRRDGRTDPALRHAAAWEQTALDCWREGNDRAAADYFARAREIVAAAAAKVAA